MIFKGRASDKVRGFPFWCGYNLRRSKRAFSPRATLIAPRRRVLLQYIWRWRNAEAPENIRRTTKNAERIKASAWKIRQKIHDEKAYIRKPLAKSENVCYNTFRAPVIRLYRSALTLLCRAVVLVLRRLAFLFYGIIIHHATDFVNIFIKFGARHLTREAVALVSLPQRVAKRREGAE